MLWGKMEKLMDDTKVKVTEIVERLKVFFETTKEWVSTNWSRVIEKFNGVIIGKSTIYSSRCWNCKEPIKSIKSEYKLIGFVQNKWIGSMKCSKHDCNYFICTNCSNCLCDSLRYVNWSKTTSPRMRKWEPEETLSYFAVAKEFFKARKLDTQIFNE
tara:strand:- start:333 stop:803 length:471 start_codon:yes stop_codon:yes gene_type:complete